MSIFYENLNDPGVRAAMASEVRRDLANKLYESPRLSTAGRAAWPQLLLDAIEKGHDDAWLESQLRAGGYLNSHEERRKPKGGTTVAAVPVTAATTLAEGEFNRFYARGLCAHVIESGGAQVEVYRGKSVTNPRSASEAMIGQRVQAKALLDDLRVSQGVEPALGLPPGPNSGLTIRKLK